MSQGVAIDIDSPSPAKKKHKSADLKDLALAEHESLISAGMAAGTSVPVAPQLLAARAHTDDTLNTLSCDFSEGEGDLIMPDSDDLMYVTSVMERAIKSCQIVTILMSRMSQRTQIYMTVIMQRKMRPLIEHAFVDGCECLACGTIMSGTLIYSSLRFWLERRCESEGFSYKRQRE